MKNISDELLKETIYLLYQSIQEEGCLDWIEGIGDCGKCFVCRILKCYNLLLDISNLKIDSEDEM